MSKPSHVATVRGTLEPDGTLRLDQPPDLPPGPVLITVCKLAEPAGAGPSATRGGPPGFWETMRQIRESQDARGYVPPSAEEVDAFLRELREVDEEHDRRMDELYDAVDRSKADRPGEAPEGGPASC